MRAYFVEDSPEEPKITELLGAYPDIRPAPAGELLATEERQRACSTWLVKQKMFQLPTLELVEWLRTRIGGRSALEICAGHGWLGEALGVPSTDGWVFDHPIMRERAALVGEQTCHPLPRVERLDALAAVMKYKPKVVFACYATHFWCEKTRTGSALGVNDAEIFRQPSVETYILVGGKQLHGPRPFLKRKHETFEFPWLFGRAPEPRIWVWEK